MLGGMEMSQYGFGAFFVKSNTRNYHLQSLLPDFSSWKLLSIENTPLGIIRSVHRKQVETVFLKGSADECGVRGHLHQGRVFRCLHLDREGSLAGLLTALVESKVQKANVLRLFVQRLKRMNWGLISIIMAEGVVFTHVFPDWGLLVSSLGE